MVGDSTYESAVKRIDELLGEAEDKDARIKALEEENAEIRERAHERANEAQVMVTTAENECDEARARIEALEAGWENYHADQERLNMQDSRIKALEEQRAGLKVALRDIDRHAVLALQGIPVDALAGEVDRGRACLSGVRVPDRGQR